MRLKDEENQKQCLPVLMGATAEGRKELIAVVDGVRERKQSWQDLRLDLKQRCWVHKTANVLNKMPKAFHGKAKRDLHQIWLAETTDAAIKAFDHFLEKYGATYEGACSCLAKDQDVLLAFYDFPAEYWGHLRMTNPVESTFATIRPQHRRTKGSGSRKASLTILFKLAQSASRRWRRLNGDHQIVLVLEGKVFTDGVLQNAA